VAAPSAGAGPGRELVLAGLAAITLVLFAGAARRGVARANAGLKTRAGAAARLVRDQLRIGPALKRLLSP
jgi:hypothetical protein